MKSIKQIRELQVQLSENVESAGDVRKLTTLVRAGLFDPNKLTMLKRALNKENVKMTRAERDALLELLDRLLTVVMANQSTFLKVKQSIQEELSPEHDGEFSMARSDLKTAISSAQRILDKLNGEGKLEAWLQSKITLASDYLSSAANYVDSGEAELKEEYEEYDIENLDEATRTDVDINQIPPIIIMKRRAIRVFPDGQKVALYWADRINKYISVPFQSIGISEDYDPKDANKDDSPKMPYYRSRVEKERMADAEERRKNRTKTLRSNALKDVASLAQQHGIAAGLGGALGTALYRRANSKIYKRAAKIRSGYNLSKSNPAAFAAKQKAVGIRESYQNKLALIRESKYGKADAALDAASFIPGPAGSIASLASAARSLKRKDYVGAALDAAGALPGVGYLAKGAKVARVASKALRPVSKGGKITDPARLARRTKALKAIKSRRGGKLGGLGAALAGAAGGAGAATALGGDSQPTNVRVQRPDSPAFKGSTLRTGSSFDTARQRAANVNFARQQQENYKMIKSIAESAESKELKFADGAVELTPSVAGKIVETYNALNATNKKIVLEMINKDKNSFMKFANFASGK